MPIERLLAYRQDAGLAKIRVLRTEVGNKPCCEHGDAMGAEGLAGDGLKS